MGKAFEADVKRGDEWATTYIKTHFDAEQKCVANAIYEVKGLDLRKALLGAFLAGQVDGRCVRYVKPARRTRISEIR
jgi:hypothetical protein